MPVGVLNSKDKFSHRWRAASNITVNLNALDSRPLTRERRSFLYRLTSHTLYRITDNQEHAKIIEAMPDAKIYRPELSPKEWKGTGLVLNDSPRTQNHCTRLWDVGVYDELDKHRSSKDEKEKYGGEILNYDHIPSTAVLKNKSSAEIEQCESDLAVAKSELKTRMQSPPVIIGTTRKQKKIILVNPKIAKLEKKIAEIEVKLEKLKTGIKSETEDLAFAIAIPKKLHKQGETFLESAQAQSSSTEHPFLKDIIAYLDMLESRPEDFNLRSSDDYIKALGAFRYLYHTQCKPPESSLSEQYPIGRISHYSFFQDPAVKKKIDSLFQERIRSLMTKREGETRGTKLSK